MAALVSNAARVGRCFDKLSTNVKDGWPWFDAAPLGSPTESRNRPVEPIDQSFPRGEQVPVAPVEQVAAQEMPVDDQPVEHVTQPRIGVRPAQKGRQVEQARLVTRRLPAAQPPPRTRADKGEIVGPARRYARTDEQ